MHRKDAKRNKRECSGDITHMDEDNLGGLTQQQGANGILRFVSRCCRAPLK